MKILKNQEIFDGYQDNFERLLQVHGIHFKDIPKVLLLLLVAFYFAHDIFTFCTLRILSMLFLISHTQSLLFLPVLFLS